MKNTRKGYANQYLRVDLTAQKIESCELETDLVERFLGGSGIAAKFLYDETTPDTHPLGPENVLIAFAGPLTGSGAPASSRHHVVARSPRTGIYGESNVGGTWGVHLKKAGYDGIVITGRAETPVYLWINENKAEIRRADQIWGQDAFVSAAWIKKETSDQATVAVIGQAGERLAPIAGIPHIGRISRIAARTGLGAVMGSKNLKAMAVHGELNLPLADPEGFKKTIGAALEFIGKATETFGKFGTSGGVDNYEKIGNFPLKNWRESHWTGAARISGAAMHETILTGRGGCWRCPIACGRHIKIKDGPYAGLEGEGPEYETIGTLGGECLVDDLKAICKANELCNRYGLDTISTGATIAFAMEAYEKGLITKKDADGIELNWGNAEAMVDIIHKMGRREGLGELMSRGSKAMAEALGRNAIEFAVHVKGLEPSAHDPRRFFSQALSYCTAARGACHNASWSHAYEMALTMPEIGIDKPQDAYQTEGKAEFTAKFQDFSCAMDCVVLCRFSQVGRAVKITDTTEWLNLATGMELDVPGLMTIGRRVFNLKRLFNTRLGVSRKDGFLPPRLLTLNRKADDLTTQLPPIGKLLADYCQYRGWSEEGIPTVTSIQELGLDDLDG
ncbi:MAG: aldehyde ferredoxin oxidoreductase family protein [Deltaproteobacteria bacterium]|nr:aldehyde ferredoxin oxidoreductase family protein [Deltaproteobacteria bacterium]